MVGSDPFGWESRFRSCIHRLQALNIRDRPPRPFKREGTYSFGHVIRRCIMKNAPNRRNFLKGSSLLAASAFVPRQARRVVSNIVGKSDKLALHGGLPVRSRDFSSVWPIFDRKEEEALLSALRSRDWCCIRGHWVHDFEKTFADVMGSKRAFLSNGGTTALRASLYSLGVGPGDEVITTPNTFIATINPITNLYALPVFVDIDPLTGSMDPDLVEAAITENTRAIMPVHLSGWPVDIHRIVEIGEKHGIPVIEDACQSVFAEVEGKKVGTFGKTGCVSFQEWKSLVAGEGGAVMSDDEEVIRHCGGFIDNGRDPDRKLGGYPYGGSNHRMTEFQGAVLSMQYERFREQDEVRQANGRFLEEELGKIEGLSPRKRYRPDTRFNYMLFDMAYDPAKFEGVSAAKFAEAVRAEGIPVSGGPYRSRAQCHRQGMLEEHLSSRGFENSFGKARLDAYRNSLEHLPVVDGKTDPAWDRILIDSKILFLHPREDIQQIVEAFNKVAESAEMLG